MGLQLPASVFPGKHKPPADPETPEWSRDTLTLQGSPDPQTPEQNEGYCCFLLLDGGVGGCGGCAAINKTRIVR